MSELPNSPEIPSVAEKPAVSVEKSEMPKAEEVETQQTEEVATPLPPILQASQETTPSVKPAEYSQELVNKGAKANKYARFATVTFREFQQKLAKHYQELKNMAAN